MTAALRALAVLSGVALIVAATYVAIGEAFPPRLLTAGALLLLGGDLILFAAGFYRLSLRRSP